MAEREVPTRGAEDGVHSRDFLRARAAARPDRPHLLKLRVRQRALLREENDERDRPPDQLFVHSVAAENEREHAVAVNPLSELRAPAAVQDGAGLRVAHHRARRAGRRARVDRHDVRRHRVPPRRAGAARDELGEVDDEGETVELSLHHFEVQAAQRQLRYDVVDARSRRSDGRARVRREHFEVVHGALFKQTK